MFFNPEQKPWPYQKPNFSHPLAKGLVGCWLFNEGAGGVVHDLSGNGNNGTFVGTPTWESGPLLSFNNFDRILISQNSGFDFGLNDFTVSVWFKTTTTSTQENRILAKYTGGDGSKYWGFLTGSAENTNFYAQNVISSNYPVWDNKWHHLVGTRENNGTKTFLYIDGFLRASGTIAAVDLTWTAPFNIGSFGDYYVNDFRGKLDAVCIWNRSLSANEDALLYREPYAMFDDQVIIYGSGGGSSFIPRREIGAGVGRGIWR